MLDENIKQQALEIASGAITNEDPPPHEDTEEPLKDWEVLRKNAKDKLSQGTDTLEDNEKKYDGVLFIVYTDESGEIKETAIVDYYYFDENGNHVSKMNEFGYDRLPKDVQEAFGAKEDVVGNWITWNESQGQLYDAFIDYHRDDSHGYDTWEEYRDTKLGKEEVVEKVTIEPAEHVGENAPPRETPTVEQGETLILKK
ncbi:hypothetical protein ATE84_2936 [Aquimarina sp. MAR_2010_214]|uniref:hypothetical protein n=1 Tax=Aquimarina sp. MAR_2010_214 TaxID=1250026 RepID=UPI000C70624C|nr:hypothetical protein [Aquimarina sp. MAR_2010_214]PKV50868.1 hypothetical protein ATE84_2936 [Aquimarina sp. MAR_2010_214]